MTSTFQRKLSIAALAVAASLSTVGCSHFKSSVEPPPPPEARFDKILETHAHKISSAWVRLADVRGAIKKNDTQSSQSKSRAALSALDQKAPPVVFSGDIEDFIAFIASDMKGWTAAHPEGYKQSVAHTVNIRSSEGATYRDVLTDASNQLSGQLEIVVNPAAQSLRVRYSTRN